MIDLVVRGTRLADDESGAPVDLLVDDGQFVAINPAGTEAPPARTVIDAAGAMASAPYVEPHVHLDTTLTAGQPRWNLGGTLWEGIACWSERKATLTRDDVISRAEEVLRWQVANGVLHVRSHVDVTDPDLVALEALAEVRERLADVVNLQLVAFPRKGSALFPTASVSCRSPSSAARTLSAPSRILRTPARTVFVPWKSRWE